MKAKKHKKKRKSPLNQWVKIRRKDLNRYINEITDCRARLRKFESGEIR